MRLKFWSKRSLKKRIKRADKKADKATDKAVVHLAKGKVKKALNSFGEAVRHTQRLDALVEKKAKKEARKSA
jgi:hypothetical protein